MTAVLSFVESEKTAVIAAGILPKYIWLATGGKSQFNARLSVLKGRTIIAFPDVDGYDLWRRKAAEMRELQITVSDLFLSELPHSRAAIITSTLPICSSRRC